jgi:hypothetical protein
MIRALAVAVTLAACAAIAPAAHADPTAITTYAVIGDTPYGSAQLTNFPYDVGEINADPQVSRVIHLGDIKNGSTTCPSSYFNTIRSDFDGFHDPLVYTPGDNEWTDCHRANNGAYQPAGPPVTDAASLALLGPDARNPDGTAKPSRLDEVRRIMFPVPGMTLGQSPAIVEHQAAPYVENVSWAAARQQFGVLDVPGSNNDLLPWFGSAETQELKAIQADEVAGRGQADLAWLDHIFDSARTTKAHGVVLGLQADMWDPAITGDSSQHSAFTPIVQRLAALARAFRRPVLLLNGDSHVFTDDHPLADPAHPENKTIYGLTADVPNLRRITVNGSTTPCHEYLRLHFAPETGTMSYERVQLSHQAGIVYPPGSASCPRAY